MAGEAGEAASASAPIRPKRKQMSADFVADPVWSRPPPSAACPSMVAAPARQRRPTLAVSREHRLIATVERGGDAFKSFEIRPLPGARLLIHTETTRTPSLSLSLLLADSTKHLVPAGTSVPLRRRLADGRQSALAAGHHRPRDSRRTPTARALESRRHAKYAHVSCVTLLASQHPSQIR